MLRTIAEIRQGRVTIQETDSGTTVTVAVDNAQSSLTGPLYKAAVDAERELVAAEGDRENLIRELDVAVGTLKVREDQVIRLKDQVAELEKTLAARDNLLRDATAQVQLLSATLGRISGAVHTPALSDALRTTWQDKKAQAMRKAVREVRHLLGSPVPHQP